MARLFAVYKVENGSKVLLGGVAENRRTDRGRDDRRGLLMMALRKFADSLEEGSTLVLEEET